MSSNSPTTTWPPRSNASSPLCATITSRRSTSSSEPRRGGSGGPDTLLPVIGEMLSGRFRIERLLGRGGMSSVWQAYDEELGRPVAIKLLHARRLQSPDSVDRFERQARTLALLAVPGPALCIH